MFDQLFSRRNSEVEHASPTRESGTPVSPHMPISQCIAGEVAGIGISIGYCDSPPLPVISVESIVAAKPWYEDFPDYSLISVGPRDGNEEEPPSTGHTRGWNASGFIAAICGIGIALSFWTPRNLWVIMGGFGLRREKRQHKSREQVRVQAREGVYVHERIGTKSGGKGKQRAIETSESEGESSATLGESTPLLASPPVPPYNRIEEYDSGEEPEHTFNRVDSESAENLLTTIEEDIEPRSLPRNLGFQLPERKLQTEQPILEGPEAAEVATPDSEGQCPFHVRKNSLQIQPLPASIVIPTEKPASIRRPRSQESIAGSPPKDSPASSYRSRSLPRAFAMRDSARRLGEEVEAEEKEKKVEEPQAMEPEGDKATPEPIQAEEPKKVEKKEDKEETPVFNLIPATPATIPQEVRDAAEASMKETRDDEATTEEDRKDYRKTLSDSASIRSKKHSRANSLSDLKEELEPAAPARGNSGSLTVDYKGKQPATSDEDDISIVDHPVSASPDQLSINEEAKKAEEPKPAPVADSPSHGPPPSRGGSFMDDGKSISSQDPKSSPSRKGSFRRMVSAGLPTRKPSNDAMKREGSLRRSLTSVMPGGKSKKRDKSAPPSSASSQILKLDTEASAGSKSTTDVREAVKPSNGSINTASPVKPDETPGVSPVAGPSTDDAQSTKEEEKLKPPSRRTSWWGLSKELKRKNSIAKSDKGEEVVTRPATATSTAAPAVAPATPERNGKEVERPADVTTDATPSPAPAAVSTEGVAKSDTPVTATVEPTTAETPVAEAPAAAAPSPPKPMLRERVKSV
ncbi:unnamed protein product, partial [Tuber aestivum]